MTYLEQVKGEGSQFFKSRVLLRGSGRGNSRIHEPAAWPALTQTGVAETLQAIARRRSLPFQIVILSKVPDYLCEGESRVHGAACYLGRAATHIGREEERLGEERGSARIAHAQKVQAAIGELIEACR